MITKSLRLQRAAGCHIFRIEIQNIFAGLQIIVNTIGSGEGTGEDHDFILVTSDKFASYIFVQDGPN